MKVLITGSLGFIATNLILSLSHDKNLEIIGIDDCSANSTNQRYTDTLCCHHNIGLNDVNKIASVLENVDLVIHLAAKGNVAESIQNPFASFENNVVSTLNLLESMRKAGVYRIIFASTGGALMGDTRPPVNEESVPCPISPYGASKLACEGYLSAYCTSYSLSAIALRFGNVYGRYSLHKSGVINRWIKAAISETEITVYGDGTSTRDYINVVDITAGIKSAINLVNRDSSIGRFQKFHLANSEEVSLISLYTLISRIHGSPIRLRQESTRAGEVSRNFADTSMANEVLSFIPSIGLEDGLTELYHWLKVNA